jgi:hypothetical protein
MPSQPPPSPETPPAISIYSRPIQELMGYMPSFWAKWSISLMLLLIVALLALLSQVTTQQQYRFTVAGPTPLVEPASSATEHAVVRALPPKVAAPIVQVRVIGDVVDQKFLRGGTYSYVQQLAHGPDRYLVTGTIVGTQPVSAFECLVDIKVARVRRTTLPSTNTLVVETAPQSVLAESFYTVFKRR